MTEAEWLACTDPHLLLNAPISISRRQRLLFACGCARRVWYLITDDTDRACLPALEGLRDAREIAAGFDALAVSAIRAVIEALARSAPLSRSGLGANAVSCFNQGVHELAIAARVRKALSNRDSKQTRLKERRSQRQLLREIVGNPFQSVQVLPAWRTWNDGLVVNLAQAMDDEGFLDRLPILGDALEEAGCTNEEILSHCRGRGKHVRGCWVVEAVLGRT